MVKYLLSTSKVKLLVFALLLLKLTITAQTPTPVDIATINKRISLAQSDILLVEDSVARKSYRTNIRDIISAVNARQSAVSFEAGMPNFRPTEHDPKICVDTVTSLIYAWRNDGWYAQGTITSTVAPSANIQTDIVNNVNVKLTWLTWYNPNTNKTSYYSYANGGGWVALEDKANDAAVVHIINDEAIAGKKTFADTASFTRGLTANGIKTTGTASTAASTVNGVQSKKIAEITRDTLLNGTFNICNVTLSGSNITLTLPVPNSSNIGWGYTVFKKNISAYNVITIEPGTSFTWTILSGGNSETFFSDGAHWSISK